MAEVVRRARLRGLLAAPLARVLAVGVAVVAAAAGIATMISGDERPTDAEPGRPFYMEAEVSVSSPARTIGTNIAGRAEGDPEESRSTLRWWWRDANHFRVEYANLDPAHPREVSIFVGDGEWQWFYRGTENTYSRHRLEPLPEGITVRPIAFSVLLGALPVPKDVDTAQELLEQLSAGNSAPGRWSTLLGEETILGHRAAVIEWGPYGTSRTTRSDGTSVETSSGSSKLWLDVERMVALRHSAESDAQSFDARVTRLDYGVHIPAERFHFEPPPGATEASSDSGSAPEAITPPAP